MIVKFTRQSVAVAIMIAAIVAAIVVIGVDLADTDITMPLGRITFFIGNETDSTCNGVLSDITVHKDVDETVYLSVNGSVHRSHCPSVVTYYDR